MIFTILIFDTKFFLSSLAHDSQYGFTLKTKIAEKSIIKGHFLAFPFPPFYHSMCTIWNERIMTKFQFTSRISIISKMLYESCRRFTQVSSTANENCLEFSFDFRMSKSDKKGTENGVDAYTKNR